MQELFFFFSIILAIGMAVYLGMQSLIKADRDEIASKLTPEELDEMEYLITATEAAGPSMKFLVIVMMGGTAFSQAMVTLLDLPFLLLDKLKLKLKN